jgi:two-component system chemotaxis sensor kinase CheA
MDELQLFLEDANEQLSLMEDALINIQDNGIDDESVAAVFRAMHTIKGTAGMFGFSGVVEFTHVAENLLSEIRSHKKELDKDDFSDLFFSVKDMVEALIKYYVNHLELDDENSKKRDELLVKLKSLL